MSHKPDLNGKYIFHSQENFDAFLAATDVPWLMRKAASVAKPTCEITQNGDEFHVKLVAMKTIEEKFTVGTNFEQTHIHGAEYVVSPSWEGDKLVWTLVPKEGTTKGKPHKQARYLEDADTLVMELTVGDVKAKRIFKRTN